MAPASLVAWRWESLKHAGTVTTTSLTSLPVKADAVSFILVSTMEEISSAEKVLVSPLYATWILGVLLSLTTLKGQCLASLCTTGSSYLRPMRRLASKMVLMGFMAHWLLAASPMRRSVSVKATYDGVVRLPWSLAMISTRSFCQIPTHEYVVPRSIPTAVILRIPM